MWLLALSLFIVVFCLRVYAILPKKGPSVRRNPKRKPTDKCSLAVFLGSGGHTGEAILLLFSLDFTRYTPRTYIISEGDSLSAEKAFELETRRRTDNPNNGNYSVIFLPRARRVHQSFFSTPPTFMKSLMHAAGHVFLSPALRGQPFADVLILNGPGTCVPVCLAAYTSRFLGFPSPRLIYVESFARVKKLSLSGKLLRPFVDRFLSQWPAPIQDGGRGECTGWLV